MKREKTMLETDKDSWQKRSNDQLSKESTTNGAGHVLNTELLIFLLCFAGFFGVLNFCFCVCVCVSVCGYVCFCFCLF